MPDTECRLVDPGTGQDAAEGERGELWIRGPQVMTGYLNDPDATAATIDADGWLHTGDAAVIGVPEKESGEELPRALVVRAPGSELTEDGVMEYMAGEVAPHKKIRMVEFIEVVPKSAAGKIPRKDLENRTP